MKTFIGKDVVAQEAVAETSLDCVQLYCADMQILEKDLRRIFVPGFSARVIENVK